MAITTLMLIAIVLTMTTPPHARANEGPTPTAEGGSGTEPTPMAEGGADGFYMLGGKLWLGGDVTFIGSVFETAPSSFEIDDLNLLVRYEPLPRLAFFSETRLENTLKVAEDREPEVSPDVAIERLYVDWIVGSGITLRAGKFLTPFGLWNVIRRGPLTWTVERPLVTELVFPEHTTGIGVIYQTTIHGWSLDATAYGPAQDELPLRSSDEDSRLLAGGRIAVAHTLGSAFVTFGVNGAAAERDDTSPMRGLYGADLEVTVAGHQIMAELASEQAGRDGGRDTWGLYVQDAIPLAQTLYAVLRYEHFTPGKGDATDGGLVGIAWRPWQHLIVKADYQFASTQIEDLQRGLLTSVALFF